MKLIYLANIRIPTEKAHGVQIMHMCEAFADLGQEVCLVVPARHNYIKADPHGFYGVKNNFKIIFLPCIDFVRFDRFLGPLAFWLQTVFFFSAAKIYLLFKRYDLIYSRNTIASLFFKGAVLEVHFLSKAVHWWDKYVWQRAGFFVVITAFLSRRLTELGIKKEKIMVAPDGVDVAKFNIKAVKSEARDKVGLPQDKKIAMYFGSFYLYDWKGIDVLLEAARNFGEGYLFVLVGGKEKEIEKIKHRGIPGNVLLLGRRPYAMAPFYMAAADALVLPNKTGQAESDEYTSPLKLFEYMAAGRPIVASDIPSVREILDAQNALLVAPNDPEELARGINRVLADQDLARSLAEKALQDVEKYTWQKRAADVIMAINGE